ncbi:MAG: hypothetical protein NZO16_02615 [Deltaproteobacteria bacterium]|nr:hypothetical protein [Deltaproteobacteria bacterium]
MATQNKSNFPLLCSGINAIKFFLVVFVLTTIQLSLIIGIPKILEFKYSDERINEIFRLSGAKSVFQKIKHSSIDCNFLSDKYFDCRGVHPFKGFKILLFKLSPNKKSLYFFQWLISISGYLAYSIVIASILRNTSNPIALITLFFFLLFSNPALSLILFEPYTLLCIALSFLSLTVGSAGWSFLLVFVSAVINPVCTLIHELILRLSSAGFKKFATGVTAVVPAIFLHVYLDTDIDRFLRWQIEYLGLLSLLILPNSKVLFLPKVIISTTLLTRTYSFPDAYVLLVFVIAIIQRGWRN